MTDTVAPEHRSVLRVVLESPRAVWVLVIGVFVNRICSFFATFATLFLVSRGFGPTAIPLILVGVGAAGLIGSLGGGWLADRVGHRAALVTSMFATAATLVLLAVATTQPLIAAAVCVVGLFAQSYMPAAAALLVANSAPADRVPTFAFFRLALNVGAALGPLIAGVVASRSYTLLFLLNAGTCLLCGLVILIGLRPRTAVTEVPAEPAEPAPAARAKGVHLPAAVLCVLLFIVAVIYVQHQSSLPLQLTEHGFTTEFYGILLAINGFVVIVLELPISSITRKLPWWIPLTVGVMVMAIGLTVAGLSYTLLAVVPAFVLFTLGEMIFAPVANAAVAEFSPSTAIARYQGLLATAQTLGFSLGPAIGTAILFLGGTALWLGMLALAAAVCLGILVLKTVAGTPAAAH